MSRLTQKLEEALARRSQFEDASFQDTDAVRLFSGEREGIAGLAAERLGPAVVLYLYEGKNDLSAEALREIGTHYLKRLPAQGVYLKHCVTDRLKKVEDNTKASPLIGREVPATVKVLERGTSFQLMPYGGFSTGLFLDQREHRQLFRERSSGLRVLNLFAYTCAFGVASAEGGALTVNVDLAKKALEWGKVNYALNDLRTESHRFIVEDAFRFLKRAAKRKEKFDRIIVDPPSFSRSKEGGTFSVKKDWKRLLEACAGVLAEEGDLFFSSNLSTWTSESLEKDVKKAWPELKSLALPPSPLDFRWETNPLSAVWIRP